MFCVITSFNIQDTCTQQNIIMFTKLLNYKSALYNNANEAYKPP